MKPVFRLLVLVLVVVFLAGCSQPALPPLAEASLPPQPTALPPTSPPLTVPVEAAASTVLAPQPTMPASQPTAAPAATAEPVSLVPSPLPCSGELTSPNMEGPYYKIGAPEKTSLIEPGMPGTPILLTGGVFDQDCNPIVGAKLDFWQADASGVYDNAGYTLRGYTLTGPGGAYAIETIAPGPYTGRPPHIHVKVFTADGRELLTTQLYFPGSENSSDVQAAPDLLVSYSGLDAQGRQVVLFNFVVRP